MKSIPAASSICASFRLLSQLLFQRAAIFVGVIPDEQLVEKVPRRNRSPESIGC